MMGSASYIKSCTQSCEFGCGFLVFGCFSQVCKILGLFFMFCLGLTVLQFTWFGSGLFAFICGKRVESNDLINGYCSKKRFDNVCDPKFSSFKCNSLKFWDNFKSQKDENDLLIGKELVNANIDTMEKDVEEDDNDKKIFEEDQEFDVLALRRLVKIERQRLNMAHLDLEKERMAAASAAEEAMAMIMRLQSEKSAVVIEANHYRRVAKHIREYDQEVIQSLEWIVMKHESERSELEEQLKLCKQKLKMYVKEDEIDPLEEVDANRSLFYSTMENGVDL
ncbi:Zein-binding domain-containing protein [Cephalotus follicularis]|uniref:Zein-binding domain-containing protein n=1 Tax=Cephalotus follicularis TaxID=3775 RepID=A0A1Q3CXG5_CEPFO|nr:Zein-binding domain-containing protein [Cephalotus follicularis]